MRRRRFGQRLGRVLRETCSYLLCPFLLYNTLQMPLEETGFIAFEEPVLLVEMSLQNSTVIQFHTIQYRNPFSFLYQNITI